MTTQAIPFFEHSNRTVKNIPVTAHGRALYTVAWFTHGIAEAINYDHRHLTVQDIVKNI